jgi:short-subunit dehydrogenase
MSMSGRYGPWALVTGASSGIGLAFARELAARALNVVLVARRIARLEEIAHDLAREHSVEARPVACDLMDDEFLSSLAPALADLEIGLLEVELR